MNSVDAIERRLAQKLGEFKQDNDTLRQRLTYLSGKINLPFNYVEPMKVGIDTKMPRKQQFEKLIELAKIENQRLRDAIFSSNGVEMLPLHGR